MSFGRLNTGLPLISVRMLRDWCEIPTSLFISLRTLIELADFIFSRPLSSLLVDEIIASTYLYCLDEVLSSPQYICQSGHLIFSQGKLEPTQEQPIKKGSVG